MTLSVVRVSVLMMVSLCLEKRLRQFWRLYRFKSYTISQQWRLVQLVERYSDTVEVDGSNPSSPTKLFIIKTKGCYYYERIKEKRG